jgi:hypothetical protein
MNPKHVEAEKLATKAMDRWRMNRANDLRHPWVGYHCGYLDALAAQGALLEKAIEQRNWYRERYWDDVVPASSIEDDDAELNAALVVTP